MKLLITGISGLLGSNLAAFFRKSCEVVGLYNRHPVNMDDVQTLSVDLRDYGAVRRSLQRIAPDRVIHCASRTDIDGIEADQESGWQANVLTTRVLIDALRDSNAKVVYISSDSVYPGEKGPYREDMEPGPKNWYGATKLEGEKIVLSRPDSLVLRTNLYGWNIREKRSLAEWLISSMTRGEAVTGFTDARFSSIYTMVLAELIDECMEKELTGVYNCACSDDWSKYEFGRRLAMRFDLDPDRILPGTLRDHGFQANRGGDLSLDVRRLESALGRSLPTMEQSLDALHRDWRDGLPGRIKENATASPYAMSWPRREKIAYGSQVIDKEDIDAVVDTLKSTNLTQGPMVEIFEANLGKLVGCRYVVAVNSGTSALHIACLACGVGPGDEVITSPNTFVASANAAAYCGARPVFGDIDPRTYNISPLEVEKKITSKTKAVIPVHFAGQSCDMAAIAGVVHEAEKKYGHRIFIIEDACHALGSRYQNDPIGACVHSDMAVTSFHPVKHITTGEGGAVFTNDSQLNGLLRRLRSHGITSQPEDFQYPDRAFCKGRAEENRGLNFWYYEQHHLGFNYRITDLQCSLGSTQLSKFDAFRKIRRRIVDTYNEAFGQVERVGVPYESTLCDSNFHLYVLCIDFEGLGLNRAVFMNALRKKGIQTQVHYIPVHTQPYYQTRFGTRWGDCPEAENYYGRCLSIPLFPGMGSEQVQYVIDRVSDLCKG